MNKIHLSIPAIYLGLTCSVWSDDFAQTPQEETLCKSMGIVNHECDCVRFVNRAYANSDKTTKTYNANRAIDGCNYHLKHINTNNNYWTPNAYMQIGLAQQIKKQTTNALLSFNKALLLNPKLQQAYIETSRIFLQLNNKEKALDTVSEGLRWLPDSRTLQRQYQKLGGVLPYPKPHEEHPTANQPKEVIAPLPAPIGIETPADKKSTSRLEPAGPAYPTAPIGSENNPWCRFCPDTPLPPTTPLPSTPAVAPKDVK